MRGRPSVSRKLLIPIISVVVAATIVSSLLWLLSWRREPRVLFASENYTVLDLAAPDEWKQSHEVFFLLDGRRVTLPVVLKVSDPTGVSVTSEGAGMAVGLGEERIPLQTEPKALLDWGPVISFGPGEGPPIEPKDGKIEVTVVMYYSFRPGGHAYPGRKVTWKDVKKLTEELPMIDLSHQERECVGRAAHHHAEVAVAEQRAVGHVARRRAFRRLVEHGNPSLHRHSFLQAEEPRPPAAS